MAMDIDLEAPGKHQGFIRIHHSTDESAYGSIEIPIISIRGGSAPVILCIGGNHGDEFEGQAIWTRLARELAPQDVLGQLIRLPALNVPAAIAGRRVSPIDGLNLNRVFPGSPSGTPTQRIAHAVEHDLLPRCSFVIDLHSGGRSLHYLPGPSVGNSSPDFLKLLHVFGGPVGYVFDESSGGGGGMLDACHRRGIGRMGSEIGGLGSLSPAAVRLGYAGTLRVLAYLRAINPERLSGLSPPEVPSILRRGGTRSDHFIYSPGVGLFEPFLDLGERVEEGQPVGQLVTPELPWRAPLEIRARIGGTLICRRGPGRAQQGDGLVVLGTEISGAL
jgi:uncharacterized protein